MIRNMIMFLQKKTALYLEGYFLCMMITRRRWNIINLFTAKDLKFSYKKILTFVNNHIVFHFTQFN